MNPSALLAELHRQGVRLQAAGDQLLVEAPPGVLTPETRSALVSHKADLLVLLAPPAAAPPLVRTTEESPAQELLALPLSRFAEAGQCLAVRVPWHPTPLWFVPDAPAAEALILAGAASRGVIWTAGELADVLSVPGVTAATVRSVAEAKAALDGEVVDVRPPVGRPTNGDSR